MNREGLRHEIDSPKGWFKSRRSGSNGGCVEVKFVEDGALVRDTKDRKGGTLFFNNEEWDNFISSARDGEFDKPR